MSAVPTPLKVDIKSHRERLDLQKPHREHLDLLTVSQKSYRERLDWHTLSQESHRERLDLHKAAAGLGWLHC